jgi:hypothetical protein
MGGTSALGGADGAGRSGGVTGLGGSAGAFAGDGGSGGLGFTKWGLCGERGEGAIRSDASDLSYVRVEIFVASEEAVMQEMLEPMACLVELDMYVVGPGPENCTDLDLALCEWAYEFELLNPRVVTDDRGACAANELRYDAAWLERMHGMRVALGYLQAYEGHSSVLMKYEPGMPGGWVPYGPAYWDQLSGEFAYETRFGMCGY